MLFKEIVDGRTDARTHGRWMPDIEGSRKKSMSYNIKKLIIYHPLPLVTCTKLKT